jgi:phosphoglycolate phosphatase-like HAD superfamily hydrolase
MNFPALVIFDLAGTTVEDRGQVPAAFAAALSANGITLSADQITRVRGASKRQAIRDLLPPSAQHQAEGIYEQFRHELASRYGKIALTTGFDRDLATLLLSTIGWTRNTVDVLVCGDDVKNGRPAPDLILLAMKMTAVMDPGRVANVGDTTLDLESAARAGVRWNIGVLSGAHRREALEQAPHTRLIQSVADLTF